MDVPKNLKGNDSKTTNSSSISPTEDSATDNTQDDKLEIGNVTNELKIHKSNTEDSKTDVSKIEDSKTEDSEIEDSKTDISKTEDSILIYIKSKLPAKLYDFCDSKTGTSKTYDSITDGSETDDSKIGKSNFKKYKMMKCAIKKSSPDDDEDYALITPGDLILPPVKYERSEHPNTSKYRETCLGGEFGTRIHAWGSSLKEAFEQCGMALYDYMVDLDSVEIHQKIYIEVEADNLFSLLYRFIDELRYIYCVAPHFYCKKLVITTFVTNKCDFRIGCNCFGEDFVEGKHPYGISVQGAKFLGMHIVNEPENNKFEICCTIDAYYAK